MYQTSTNVNPTQFTSQTTTTTTAANNTTFAPPPLLSNGYIDDYNNQDDDQFSNNEANEFVAQQSSINNNDRQQQQQYTNLEQSNNDSISFALDEIGAILNSKEFNQSFNVGEPTFTTNQHQQQQATTNSLYTTNNNQELTAIEAEAAATTITYQLEETKASIYENLKTIISDDQDDDDDRELDYENDNSHSSNSFHINMAASQNMRQQEQQNKSNNNNNNLKNLFNNIQFDSPAAATKTMDKTKPFVEIIEQPAKCALRFRYKCEGRSAGSLPGVNSTADNKTFPSIRINNYVGRAVVVISCVTKDIPYRAHPHNIVGKEGCKKGICTIVIQNEANMVRSFPSLGIQCVKRKDIEESLTLRESINVDPFRNGFAHKSCTSNIDLNVVRLCFQVFIQGSQPNKCDIPLAPIVSEPIHDKKAMSDLIITKLSHCSAPATGGREVILLCDRISKDDIQIRFFEERDGKLIWETFTDLAPTDVHKQVAICFKTPKYYNENISSPVMVRIQLRRLSDNQVSEPRLFQFLPCESDEDVISRKRQKIEWVNMNHYELDNILQPSMQAHHHHHHHLPPHHLYQQQQHHHQPIHINAAMQHHNVDGQQQQQQQHSPVISHQSQPPPSLVNHQRFNQPPAPPPPPLPHHLQQQQHHHQQQQHRQQLQSANSSPSHLNQPQPSSSSSMNQQHHQRHHQSMQNRQQQQHQLQAPTDHSNRTTPSPMQQQQRQQQSSPDQQQQQMVHPHLQQQQQHQQLRQSIDSPEMSVDGNRTPTAMQQQQLQQTTGTDQNLVVRREIIDNEGKVMRLVDRPPNPGGDAASSVGGPSSSVAANDAASANNKLQDLNNLNNQQQLQQQMNKQQILASSLDRIDTAELMRDIAFSSNIDLNLVMGTENELS